MIALLHNYKMYTKYENYKGTEVIYCHFKVTAWISRARVFSVVGFCNFMPRKFGLSFLCPSFTLFASKYTFDIFDSSTLWYGGSQVTLSFWSLAMLDVWNPTAAVKFSPSEKHQNESSHRSYDVDVWCSVLDAEEAELIPSQRPDLLQRRVPVTWLVRRQSTNAADTNLRLPR